MRKFEITGKVIVEIVTYIEAENEEEALRGVDGRGVAICIHGSKLAEGKALDEDFVLVDGDPISTPYDLSIEELK